MENIVVFEASPQTFVYDSDDFKVYGCDVNEFKYKNIKKNSYNNVSIYGDLIELSLDVEYEITAIEEIGRYGYGYKVLSIKRDLPTDAEATEKFLQEVLTKKQAKSVIEACPNVIQIVLKGDGDTVDISNMKGIGEYRWDLIQQKIIDNYALVELVSRFNGLLTLTTMKKLVEAYGGIKTIIRKLEENPYTTLTRIKGIGFVKADSILLDIDRQNQENISNKKEPVLDFINDLLISEDRMLACIWHNLDQNELKGSTTVSKFRLEKLCYSLTPECIDLFETVVKSNEELVKYVEERDLVTKSKTLSSEFAIAVFVLLMTSKNRFWDLPFKKYIENKSKNITLTEQQISLLTSLMKYNIVILDGKAGTGKTTTISQLTDMLIDSGKSFLMVAPTGKASQQMKKYSGIDAYTIHRGLGFRNGEWGYNFENRLKYDLIIVDEMSMTDVSLMRRLVKAIDTEKTKLLMVGDSDQIPSVGAGNVLYDLINSKKIHTVTLDKVFRFGSGGIDTVSTYIRMQKAYLNDELIQAFGEDKGYKFVNVDSDLVIESCKAIYTSLLENGVKVDDICVLSAYNKHEFGTININNELQSLVNPLYGTTDGMSFKEVSFYKNDLVMQTKNNYKCITYQEFVGEIYDDEAMVANGETGRIIEVDDLHMVIQFSMHRIVYTKKQVMKNISLAYCITIHKSQGSESKNVILITPKSHGYFLNSNLLYVGVTRAKETCFHIGDAGTIAVSVKKKANFERNTNLSYLL